MIERAKNAWAALRVAVGKECDGAIELDAEGEQMLAEHLDMLWENHIETNADLIEISRAGIASRQRLERMLDDPNIELDELVRLENKARWKQRVCQGRKSVRAKVWVMVLLAAASLYIVLFGPQQWSGIALGLSIAWLFVMGAELDGFRENAETIEVWRQYLALRRAGDTQQAMNIMDEHVRKLIARTGELLERMDMKLVDQVGNLIQKSNHEPRK